MQKSANFRFYEELNDFLPVNKRKTSFIYEFQGKPSVKDAIEAIGVPHTEIDLILVNSRSVNFSEHLQNGDSISVYPVMETLDISNVTRLREIPLRKTRFILDVHLGKLAKYIRMLGFDTLFQNNYNDSEIIAIAKTEKRIILTKDTGILKNSSVTHGYWVRSPYPLEQLKEVLEYFDLYSALNPFSRCTLCNGRISSITKESVSEKIEPMTKQCYDEFYQCEGCGKVYWKGSHYEKMRIFVENSIIRKTR